MSAVRDASGRFVSTGGRKKPKRGRGGGRSSSMQMVFVPNFEGMADLLRSDGVLEEMERRAEDVLGAADDFAPDVTGRYRRSLEVESYVANRATARVVADVPYALSVEFDHRPLGRALDAAGG